MFTKTCWIALALALYTSEAVAGNLRALQSTTSEAPKWAASTIIRDKDGNIVDKQYVYYTGKPSPSAPRKSDDDDVADEADADEEDEAEKKKRLPHAVSGIMRDKNGTIVDKQYVYYTGKPSSSAPRKSDDDDVADEADADEEDEAEKKKRLPHAVSGIMRDKNGTIVDKQYVYYTGKPSSSAPRKSDDDEVADEPEDADEKKHKWAASTIIRDKDGNIVDKQVISGSG